MSKLNSTSFYLIYFALVVILGVSIFPLWGGVLLAWISIFLFIKYKQLDQDLPKNLQKAFTLVALGYPLIESLIKYSIEINLIPYSWEWLNRVEHFGFSLMITILIAPLFWRVLSEVSIWYQAAMLVGAVNVLGNLNEFLEYLIRVLLGLEHKFALYYWDTIMDMGVNLLGALVGFLLFLYLTKQKKAPLKGRG